MAGEIFSISYNENGCWEGTKEWKSFCKRYEKEDPAWVVYSTRIDYMRLNWETILVLRNKVMDFLHWKDLSSVRFVNTSWRMTINNHPNSDERPSDNNINHRKPLVYKSDIPQPKKWVDLLSDSDSD